MSTEELQSQALRWRRRMIIRNVLEYGAGIVLAGIASRSLLQPSSLLGMLTDVTMIGAVVFVCYQLQRRTHVPDVPPDLDGLQYAARMAVQFGIRWYHLLGARKFQAASDMLRRT